MHIMEITSGTGVNGAVLHCLLLTRELARRGHRVILVCRPGAWIGNQALDNSIEVVKSDLHRFPPDELRRMAGLARRRGVDVLHTHLSRGHFFGVLLRWFSGIPCVATAQSRHFQLHWSFNDLVIAVSEATGRFHRRWNCVPPDRIEVIANFVDPACLAPAPDHLRQEVRAELGLDGSWPVIGAIGNLCARKGQLHLVRALPEILASVPDARLLLVGSEGDRAYVARVKAAAAECGVASRVVWAGYRSDVHRVLAALDLSVLASLEESLPLVILEAMAARLPVVATTVGGVAECIRDSETGLLVPSADHHALARAITWLLADPARLRAFGDAGRQWALTHFSPERQVVRIEAALARVASRRPARSA